jgi:hypothetical protein
LAVAADDETRLEAYELAGVVELVLVYPLSGESAVADGDDNDNDPRAVLLVGEVLSAFSAKLLR